MSSAIETIKSKHRPLACRQTASGGFLARLALAYKIYRERRALLGMSDDALKDIGLSRADAYREGMRPPWDLPPNR